MNYPVFHKRPSILHYLQRLDYKKNVHWNLNCSIWTENLINNKVFLLSPCTCSHLLSSSQSMLGTGYASFSNSFCKKGPVHSIQKLESVPVHSHLLRLNCHLVKNIFGHNLERLLVYLGGSVPGF